MANMSEDALENEQLANELVFANNFPPVESDQQSSSNFFKSRLRSFAYSADSNTANQLSPSKVQMRSQNIPSNAQSGKREISSSMSSPKLRHSSRKRKNEDEGESFEASLPMHKRRSTTKQRAAADPYNPTNKLVDSIRPGLILVFVGLNPGLMTAATGHAYAHPSNLFWKLLAWSGVTPKRHLPSETRDLMDLYSIGNTNICARPTRSGDGLSKKELLEGAGILDEKIAQYKPDAVCIVGKSIWETIFKKKTGKELKRLDFHYGWQDEELWLGRTFNEFQKLGWRGAKTFVTTTTSGLAASMKPDEKLEVWKPLGQWVQQKRAGHQREIDSIKDEDTALL